jgi:hypothetical protein
MIFGLLVTSAIWAPRSHVETVTMFIHRVYHSDLSIGALAAIMVFVEAVYAFTGLFLPSSALLHLAGAAVGLPVALAFLRWNVVDCGGWDWFSLCRRDRLG